MCTGSSVDRFCGTEDPLLETLRGEVSSDLGPGVSPGCRSAGFVSFVSLSANCGSSIGSMGGVLVVTVFASVPGGGCVMVVPLGSCVGVWVCVEPVSVSVGSASATEGCGAEFVLLSCVRSTRFMLVKPLMVDL